MWEAGGEVGRAAAGSRKEVRPRDLGRSVENGSEGGQPGPSCILPRSLGKVKGRHPGRTSWGADKAPGDALGVFSIMQVRNRKSEPSPQQYRLRGDTWLMPWGGKDQDNQGVGVGVGC